MRRYLVVLTLLACGCALSPAELRDQGKREEFVSKRAPLDAAQCITRTAENYRPGIASPFPAQWRDAEHRGDYEVLVRHPVDGFAMVAEVKAEQDGSRIVSWLTPNLVYQDMSQKIIEQCGATKVGETPAKWAR